MKTKMPVMIIFAVTALILAAYVVQEPKRISDAEGRMLTVFSDIKIGEFVNGSMQDHFEDALKDQIVQRRMMIETVNAWKGFSRKQYNAAVAQINKVKNAATALFPTPEESEPAGLPPIRIASRQDIATGSKDNTDERSRGDSIVHETEVDVDENDAELSTGGSGYKLEPVGDRYRIQGTDYLTLYPWMENEAYKKAIRVKTNQINEMAERFPHVRIYVYYMTKAEDLNWFNESEQITNFDYADYVRSRLTDQVTFKKLIFSNLEDYMEASYKTDHHYNHKGAHRVYTEIHEMISQDFDLSPVKEPIKEHDFGNLQWIGSTGKSAGVKVNPDVFQAYEYDLGNYKSYLNNEPFSSNRLTSYLQGNIARSPSKDQYALFYASTSRHLVKHEFDGNEHNILFITDSNNRPMRDVLASHFKTMYMLEYTAMNDYDLDNIIKQNDIDIVLIAAQNRYWTDENIHRINNGKPYLFKGYPVNDQ